MTAIVVDASVAVKWVVEETYSDAASQLFKAAYLHAPAHWLAEAVNAIWAKALRGELTQADAASRAAALLQAPVRAAPLDELSAEALSLAMSLGMTVYDALYLALALRLPAMLVTADRPFMRKAQALAAASICWVGDYPGYSTRSA